MTNKKKVAKRKRKNNCSLFVEDSITMPQNFRADKDIHSGVNVDGPFNPNSEDICLMVQLGKNVFYARVGKKPMVGLLLSDEGAKWFLNSMVKAENYEAAAKARDSESLFFYRNTVRDLVELFGDEVDVEDDSLLFGGKVEYYLLGDATNPEAIMDADELWAFLKGEVLDMACNGDSSFVEQVTKKLTINNNLSIDIVAYLLFLKGFAEESNGHKEAAKEIYAEALKLDPSIMRKVKWHEFDE
ncbi:MAG: tetratricopeptide repeat protein [Bacteroidia bacterium]